MHGCTCVFCLLASHFCREIKLAYKIPGQKLKQQKNGVRKEEEQPEVWGRYWVSWNLSLKGPCQMGYPALWFPCFITSLYTRHWNASQRGEDSFKKGRHSFIGVRGNTTGLRKSKIWYLSHPESHSDATKKWSTLPPAVQSCGLCCLMTSGSMGPSREIHGELREHLEEELSLMSLKVRTGVPHGIIPWIFTYRMVLPHLCAALLPTACLSLHTASLFLALPLCTGTFEEKEKKLNGMCLVIGS